MLEPIEKLHEMMDYVREPGCNKDVPGAVWVRIDTMQQYADEIEREIAELQESWAQEAREHADDAGRIADLAAENERLKREIAERYIELPLDAEGVPIRIGDTVIEADDTVSCKVMSLHLFDDGCWDVNTVGMTPNLLRHVKPRTIEDILFDAVGDAEEGLISPNEIIAKYADEIRSMGVGE